MVLPVVDYVYLNCTTAPLIDIWVYLLVIYLPIPLLSFSGSPYGDSGIGRDISMDESSDMMFDK